MIEKILFSSLNGLKVTNTGTKNMINYWITRADSSFAEWEAIFPPPANMSDIQRCLRCVQGILEAGEREAVYRVVETRRPLDFRAAPNWKYAQYLEKTLAETGTLPLFDMGLGVAENYDGVLRTPARLCYYDLTGKVTEQEVENVGLLLETLRPDDADWGSIFMEGVAPVTLLSRSVSLRERSKPSQRTGAVQIKISLRTDIWFPQVLGLLEGDQPLKPQPPKWYDNRELASCHTPRLNRFLSAVRQLVLELGGEWRLNPPEGMAKHYMVMVREDGIGL